MYWKRFRKELQNKNHDISQPQSWIGKKGSYLTGVHPILFFCFCSLDNRVWTPHKRQHKLWILTSTPPLCDKETKHSYTGVDHWSLSMREKESKTTLFSEIESFYELHTELQKSTCQLSCRVSVCFLMFNPVFINRVEVHEVFLSLHHLPCGSQIRKPFTLVNTGSVGVW